MSNLTFREYLIGRALGGIVGSGKPDPAVAAREAIAYADAVISHIKTNAQPPPPFPSPSSGSKG